MNTNRVTHSETKLFDAKLIFIAIALRVVVSTHSASASVPHTNAIYRHVNDIRIEFIKSFSFVNSFSLCFGRYVSRLFNRYVSVV